MGNHPFFRPILLLAAVFSFATSGCAPPANEAGGKIRVVVAIPPQAFLARQIGGRRVGVETLLGPGQSPHTYEPTPRQVARLSEARILFRVGMPFEDALFRKVRRSSPRVQLIDTRQGIALRTMREEEAETDEHAADRAAHSHAQGEADPHFWMSPRNMKTQARTISAALARIDPAGAPEYERNLRTLLDDLDALDAKMAKILAPDKGKTMFVFHPAFGYLADAYGLRQVSIETEGKEPGARRLARLMEDAKTRKIKTIFVQAQFSAKSAEAVAQAVGARVVALDPLAPSYLRNMKSIAERIAAGL